LLHFLYYALLPRDLHSFPTRRSSDLDLYYGDFHALKKVDLEIQEKEITAFIGPSGCGKSTLLKSLNRMNDLIPGCKITGDITLEDRKSTRLNSSHVSISYAVFCLKKK